LANSLVRSRRDGAILEAAPPWSTTLAFHQRIKYLSDRLFNSRIR